MKSLTIERWITRVLGLGILILLGIQLSSLFVTPIHDSFLWWGDESWLMNEYRAQMTTGVFRHPYGYGSSLWIGNPFPLTAMWLTSAIYGLSSLAISALSYVDVGRVVTALLSIIMLASLWWRGKKLALTPLSILAGIALIVSCRSYFLTSHSARYDILSALILLAILGRLISEIEDRRRSINYQFLGMLWGGSLMVSVHVPLLLILPITYFLLMQKVKARDILLLLAGLVLSVGALYAIHTITQPALSGETNLSENLRTIPILRPFSWSVQSSNLVQKWGLVVSFAPQILLCLLACVEGLRCNSIPRSRKDSIVLLILPTLGWLLFQPAGPSSYLIHFIPALALASAMSIETVLVGNWQRIGVGTITMLALTFGVRDAVVACAIGRTLTEEHLTAIAQIEKLHSENKMVAMNPAQSYLSRSPATTHFIELPNRGAEKLTGEGYLLTYNSSIRSGFIWEVAPLRSEVTSPELTLTGHFLDVGRNYFIPLDDRPDTLFLQRLDLNGLYTRHIR
jgi:hypothetical protein